MAPGAVWHAGRPGGCQLGGGDGQRGTDLVRSEDTVRFEDAGLSAVATGSLADRRAAAREEPMREVRLKAEMDRLLLAVERQTDGLKTKGVWLIVGACGVVGAAAGSSISQTKCFALMEGYLALLNLLGIPLGLALIAALLGLISSKLVVVCAETGTLRWFLKLGVDRFVSVLQVALLIGTLCTLVDALMTSVDNLQAGIVVCADRPLQHAPLARPLLNKLF